LKEELQKQFPATAGDIGIVVGSSDNEQQLQQLARNTRVVITTAGPYALYGEPLLRACVDNGTCYLDLTGETPWAAMMISKYQEKAKQTGSVVVCMSGFDSVPADLGVFFAADTARNRLSLGLKEATAHMSGTGTVSGGTIYSGINLAKNPSLQKMVGDPLLLFPSAEVGERGTGSASSLIKAMPDAAAPKYIPEFNSCSVPFVMAAINTRVVRRSQGLLAAYSEELKGHPHMLQPLPAGAAVAPPRYSPRAVAAELQEAENTSLIRRGAASPSSKIRDAAAAGGIGSSAGKTTLAYSPHFPFAYSEVMMLPVKGKIQSTIVGWITAIGMLFVNLILSSPTLARLIHPLLPQPGTGGTREQMAKAWFHYDIIAKCDDDRNAVVVRVSGGDGGYLDTSKMLVEGGMLLALEKASLPASAIGGGFLTSSTAFGRRLIEVLKPAGVSFEVLHCGTGPLPAARLREKGENPQRKQLRNKAE
jgi:short subunit dehydrogenase-like uncharacterized protein